MAFMRGLSARRSPGAAGPENGYVEPLGLRPQIYSERGLTKDAYARYKKKADRVASSGRLIAAPLHGTTPRRWVLGYRIAFRISSEKLSGPALAPTEPKGFHFARAKRIA